MQKTIKKVIFPFFIPHQGCPHQCVFCNQKRITGEFQSLSPEKIQQSLSRALDKKTINAPGEIAFYGGSFTALPCSVQENYLKSVQNFIDQGLISHIRVSTRPDSINTRILEMLRFYHVKTVELGVQSMDENVLRCSNRGHDATCVNQAVLLLRSFGMEVGLQMMTGLPGDTGFRSIQTGIRLASFKPDFIRIYPTVVIRDTPLAQMWKSGDYIPLTLENTINVVKMIHLYFSFHHIPVIRTGLQGTEKIAFKQDILAGPFHPAFGELILSEQYKDLLSSISFDSFGDAVHIHVSKEIVSQVLGQKRSNKLFLEIEKRKKIKIIKDEYLPAGAISIQNQFMIEKEMQQSMLFSLYQKNFSSGVDYCCN